MIFAKSDCIWSTISYFKDKSLFRKISVYDLVKDYCICNYPSFWFFYRTTMKFVLLVKKVLMIYHKLIPKEMNYLQKHWPLTKAKNGTRRKSLLKMKLNELSIWLYIILFFTNIMHYQSWQIKLILNWRYFYSILKDSGH